MKIRLLCVAALLVGCDGETSSKAGGGSDSADASGQDTAPPGPGGDDSGDSGEPVDGAVPEVFVLELSEVAGPADFSYLAAIPASARVNGGRPAVLALTDLSAPTAATGDLLRRIAPEVAYVTEDTVTIDHAVTTVRLDGDAPHSWSLSLADTFWTAADQVVVVSEDDYAAGVFGSSLAALLNVPLLIADPAGNVAIQQAADELGAQVIAVGIDSAPPSVGSADTSLAGLDEALAWVVASGLQVSYLTVSNTSDRSAGRSQKASLVAPMYAANRGGLSIPVSLDMPAQVVEGSDPHPVLPMLTAVYAQLGAPEHLAIVGAHDALPQTRGPSIFDNPVGEHPVSDLPYGELDEDPFLDISIGRIVGDTVEELSALATRTAHHGQMQDGGWEYGIVEAGLWGFDELRATNENVGFDAARHLSQAEIEAAGTLELAAFLHKDHSSCLTLGHAVNVDTPTLFSPAITLSRGCSVGGMDLISDRRRTIVDHLLGHGMVAFVGGTRNAIAENTLIEVSMWNQLLEGRTLGASFKHGINDAIAHWLDDGSAGLRYSIDIEIVYGDPALKLHVPGAHRTAPAAQSFDGTTLTVTAPETWTMVAYHPDQLAEWSYEGELFMYTAPGTIPRTYWAGRYDNEDMYFGVQLPLDAPPTSVSQLDAHPSPLGWGGQAHIDRHADGSATALWRVRLIDFDAQTGELLSSAAAFEYAVE